MEGEQLPLQLSVITMSLKITLKPQERMIIGGAVVTNGNRSVCDLIIDNNIPILRQKDILNEEDADSPCRKIYFLIQLMYIDEENFSTYQQPYWKLVREIVQAAPSTTGLIDQINESIQKRRYYQALKLAKHLINYEQEAIDCVQ